MKLTIPEGFVRVLDVAKNGAEKQAIYDALKNHRLPCLKAGPGKTGTVYISQSHAVEFLAEREQRLMPKHVYAGVKVTPEHSASLRAMTNLESAIDELTLSHGEMIEAQKETNRLLGEIFKLWSPNK